MKKIVLLVSFLMVLALSASAQTYINFHEMPVASTPTPMPDYYPSDMNLTWTNFYYVTPGIWSGAGPGFWVDPTPQHNSVAFIGGPLCSLATSCNGSIKLEQIGMSPTSKGFTPISMILSSGWANNRVTIMAYSNGKFVGTVTWKLTTEPYTFSFPTSWTYVTQLVFTPSFLTTNTVAPKPGSMVIYSFILMQH